MSPPPAEAVLKLVDCHVSFRQPDGNSINVLRGVSVVARPGETLAIVGRSGSGKSTLLNVLGLLAPPDVGDYRVAGVPTQSLDERSMARLRAQTFGFVFQDFALMPRHDVVSNVELPLLSATRDEWRQRRRLAREAVAAVGLSDKERSRPHQLSGGQQQRVAIARAIVRKPPFILADEPTGSLDADTGAQILSLLFSMQGRGAGVVLVTHDMEVARQCDRCIRLDHGQVLDESP